jgi:hypothetical protein
LRNKERLERGRKQIVPKHDDLNAVLGIVGIVEYSTGMISSVLVGSGCPVESMADTLVASPQEAGGVEWYDNKCPHRQYIAWR